MSHPVTIPCRLLTPPSHCSWWNSCWACWSLCNGPISCLNGGSPRG